MRFLFVVLAISIAYAVGSDHHGATAEPVEHSGKHHVSSNSTGMNDDEPDWPLGVSTLFSLGMLGGCFVMMYCCIKRIGEGFVPLKEQLPADEPSPFPVGAYDPDSTTIEMATAKDPSNWLDAHLLRRSQLKDHKAGAEFTWTSRKEELNLVFSAVDIDGSGAVDVEELEHLGHLRVKDGHYEQRERFWDMDKTKELLQRADTNKDGLVQQGEFVKYFSEALQVLGDAEFDDLMGEFLVMVKERQDATKAGPSN